MKKLLFILSIFLFSCVDNPQEEKKEEKNTTECNYLYPEFVIIEDKFTKPFGNDTLYEFQFHLKGDSTLKCYKIITTDTYLYNQIGVCDRMLITIKKEDK